MLSLAELKQAQKYPFSQRAKSLVRQQDSALDEVPEEVMARARAMVLSAMKGKPYLPEIKSSGECLANEVLAYPLAKVLVSCMKNPEFLRRFAQMVSGSVFENLRAEKPDAVFAIARELGVSAEEKFPVKIPLLSYLSAGFSSDTMKIVNQKVSAGFVYLAEADFARFLAALVHNSVLASLPVQTAEVPPGIKRAASELEQEWEPLKKKYSMAPLGRVKPEAFPPCISSIYTSLLEGRNLAHLERLDLATFLVAAGMGSEQVVSLFRNSANFNERITRYQVARIAKSRYSPPGCMKMKSHKLCNADCRAKHPLQVYRANLAALGRPAGKNP